jgi:hypothetical protein
MELKAQESKRITTKSPLITLFQRGKPSSPPFVKGRSGGIFKALNWYKKVSYLKFEFWICFEIRN